MGIIEDTLLQKRLNIVAAEPAVTSPNAGDLRNYTRPQGGIPPRPIQARLDAIRALPETTTPAGADALRNYRPQTGGVPSVAAEAPLRQAAQGIRQTLNSTFGPSANAGDVTKGAIDTTKSAAQRAGTAFKTSMPASNQGIVGKLGKIGGAAQAGMGAYQAATEGVSAEAVDNIALGAASALHPGLGIIGNVARMGRDAIMEPVINRLYAPKEPTPALKQAMGGQTAEQYIAAHKAKAAAAPQTVAAPVAAPITATAAKAGPIAGYGAKRQAQAAPVAQGPAPEQLAQRQAAVSHLESSPISFVSFGTGTEGQTTGEPRAVGKVYYKDGTEAVMRGKVPDDVNAWVKASSLTDDAQQPVELIAGQERYIASPESGNRWIPKDVSDTGQTKGYISNLAQRGMDMADPNAAALRNRLAEVDAQNKGSAQVAGIHAGASKYGADKQYEASKEGRAKDRYITMGGGQSIDPATGMAITNPVQLFDTTTMAPVQMQQQHELSPKDQLLMAIRNNKSLSAEQKKAQLKALGYQDGKANGGLIEGYANGGILNDRPYQQMQEFDPVGMTGGQFIRDKADELDRAESPLDQVRRMSHAAAGANSIRDLSPGAKFAISNKAEGYGEDAQQWADGYANGGPIKGPGNGISDSIPAVMPNGKQIALSNGEYKMPPAAVNRVGVDKLNALIAKYHKPAAQQKTEPGAFIVPADVVKKVGRKTLDKMANKKG